MYRETRRIILTGFFLSLVLLSFFFATSAFAFDSGGYASFLSTTKAFQPDGNFFGELGITTYDTILRLTTTGCASGYEAFRQQTSTIWCATNVNFFEVPQNSGTATYSSTNYTFDSAGFSSQAMSDFGNELIFIRPTTIGCSSGYDFYKWAFGGNRWCLSSVTFDSSECTSWTYSDWSTCSDEGTQTRTILTSTPSNCSGGTPESLEQSCTPTCTSWTYSDWSTCSDEGEMSRSIISASPSNCSGGDPVLTDTCTPPPPADLDSIQDNIIALQTQLNITNSKLDYKHT